MQRAYERDVARMQREQKAAYRQRREADALRRTQELDARVRELEGRAGPSSWLWPSPPGSAVGDACDDRTRDGNR
ncbi:hypothetical protein EAO70_04975 [Streptomyces sp. adm13(2018)]|nr:hypothetical protein EAO70_04975 [Streptomyces sp. adm13(2018)]